MHSKANHLAGVLAGLIAALVLGFLILESTPGLERIATFAGAAGAAGVAGVPASWGSGSPSAVVLLAAAAVIAGLLAGTWRLSPAALLAAGVPLVALGLYGEFDYVRAVLLMYHLPARLEDGSWDLELSGMWQLLGGILLLSGAWRSRWTGRPVARRRPGRGALGVVLGVAAFPALWYLIQLANPAGYVSVALATHLPRTAYLNLIPQLIAASLMAALAAGRWVAPVAAAVAGLPLLVIGLLLVLVPPDAAHWIAPYIWSSQPLSPADGQSVSLGAFLLFGGLLVTSAVLRVADRPPSLAAAPEPGATAPTSETT